MKIFRKKKARRKLGIGVLIISVSFLSFDLPNDKHFDIAKNIEIFTSVYAEVNKYYVDDIDPNKFMRVGIDAMFTSLDPYTNYIPEDDIEDYRFLSTGQYGGIGAIIGQRNGKSLILMPYEGFPADKAGLKIGDELIKIGEDDVEGKGTSDISKLLKGQANTAVTITIKRPGTEEPITLELIREKIKVKNVPYYGMVTEKVGYLKLSDFTRDATKEVKNAIVELKKEGADKIIFDLRGNPGGLLMEAISISNLFIDKGKEVVSTKGKIDKWNATYEARDLPLDREIPLIILTSSRSASAAEIVSGVAQDYDRGVLIGQRTYGKGLVQATKPTAHKTQIKVTTAKYYIPSGRCIQAIDYRNRNEDGSVGRIADSLKKGFVTANGRQVFDGGGVNPDIETTKDKAPEVLINLIEEGLIFDYATKYHYEHDSIAPAKEFALSKTEYKEFLTWLDGGQYSYKTQTEVEFEKFAAQVHTDTTAEKLLTELGDIRKKLASMKHEDLTTYEDDIREQLEKEIASRYYFSSGLVESSFDDDPEITAAVSLFEDMDRYNKILSGK